MLIEVFSIIFIKTEVISLLKYKSLYLISKFIKGRTVY